MSTALVCALLSSAVAAVPRGECFVDTCWSVSDVVVQRNITYGSAYDPVLKTNMTLTLDVCVGSPIRLFIILVNTFTILYTVLSLNLRICNIFRLFSNLWCRPQRN